MNKVNCNVIKDILPLYVDDVVSDDTRKLVSAHMESCHECQKKHESLCSKVMIPVENNAKPLKKIKQAWNRKKIMLVSTTLIVAIIIMCSALLAVEHFVYQEKITVNGAVYVQKGGNVTSLPADYTEIGYIHGISFWSTGNPTEDYMATNLDGKYGGCPIYQSNDNDQMIYLEDFSGFYIPFQLTEYITVAETE